jgi:hypothetical protein
MFEPEFYLLAQECNLAKAALLGGMTAFSYIDIDQTGSVYSALFQTSIGVERLMKMAIIIDHKLRHDLTNPTNQQLKQIGHDLIVLYQRCKTLAAEQSFDPTEWFGPGSIEHEMLALLSGFAKSSRYYNLDAISGSKPPTDPLIEWALLHQRIGETYIGYKTREKLNQNAVEFADRFGAVGWERWIDGQYIPNVDAIYLHSLLKKANPYCVWTLPRLLKPFYKLLDILSDSAHAMEVEKEIVRPVVPYATEFFPFFLASLDNVRRRKNWTKLFSL